MPSELDRLQLLYDINRRLTTFVDLDELVRYVTRRAREIFEAEGCSLLLFDADRREFYFPVASQREGRGDVPERLAEIRFPAAHGIAGWVLSHNEAVIVADTRTDTRFYAGVDQQTGVLTRSILCAPLRTRSGTIGVLEVINPAASVTTEDLRFLEALAGDVGVAHEKAALYGELRDEALGLRRLCTVAGSGLAVVGLLMGAGAVFTNRALALPLADLATHPGVLGGSLCAVIGAALVGIGQGWILPGATAGVQRP